MSGFLIGPKIPVIDEQSDGTTYGDNLRHVLRMLQALVECNVINMTTSVPPATPNNGDSYIVASGPSGAWAGQANNLAYWTTDDPNVPAGKWEFYPPFKGWVVGNQADGSLYIYSGTAWGQSASIIGSPGFGGFWGPGLDFYFGMQNANLGIAINTVAGVAVPAGTLVCYQFVLAYDTEISKVTTQSGDNTGTYICQFGIYTDSGDLVVNARAWAVSQSSGQSGSGSGVTNILPETITLKAGVYWHVQSSSSGGSANPHFPGWVFPSGGTANQVFWVKTSTKAALATNLGATGVTALNVTAATQVGDSLTLTGSFSNPDCVGQYVVLFDFGNPNYANNGNYLCTACADDTITVTNPNGVSAGSVDAFVVIPNADLPATLGVLTPFTPSGTDDDGIACPLYEP